MSNSVQSENRRFQFAIVDAPGFDGGNRTKIYSRHNSLAAARREQRKHIVHIPGNSAQQSAMIISRVDGTISSDESYLWSDAVRGTSFAQHDWK